LLDRRQRGGERRRRALLKYGFTVNHALGATLVLADGGVVEIGDPFWTALDTT